MATYKLKRKSFAFNLAGQAFKSAGQAFKSGNTMQGIGQAAKGLGRGAIGIGKGLGVAACCCRWYCCIRCWYIFSSRK